MEHGKDHNYIISHSDVKSTTSHQRAKNKSCGGRIYMSDSQINNKVAKQEMENTASTKQESNQLQGEDITIFYGTAEAAFGDDPVVADGLVEGNVPSPELRVLQGSSRPLVQLMKL
jgi:hypothetical protein